MAPEGPKILAGGEATGLIAYTQSRPGGAQDCGSILRPSRAREVIGDEFQ